VRLSDLLEQPVVDQHGRALGRVHDVHLVQDGPQPAGGDAAFRLHGLIAGRASFGARLGYSGRLGYRSDQETRGPLPIKVLVRWLQRRAVYVPWEAVTAVEDHVVRVHRAEAGFAPAGQPDVTT
jgi:sporulation protein YlmC with PRC-barrel domain